MKKLFFVIVALFIAFSTFAQEEEGTTALVSKKGEPFLPESGDWAISFDASPIFNYVGNAFNGSTYNTNPGVYFLNNSYTIVGKYFVDDKTAFRGILRLCVANDTEIESIADASSTAPDYPEEPRMVEDKWVNKFTNITLGAGYEMRKGKTRLQGYYGADAMIWFSSYADKYTYGNDLDQDNTVYSITTSFDSDNLGTDSYGNQSRDLSYKHSYFGIGIRAFIGAEYFIFPKISIGAEYGWGIGFQKSGKMKTELESRNWNGTDYDFGKQTIENPGYSTFGIDTDVNQNNLMGLQGSNTGTATVKVTFHF